MTNFNFSDKAKNQGRKTWTKEEVEELHKLFGASLSSRSLPSGHEIKKAIRKSKQMEGKLHLRNWETIKKKLWNMIEKIKKKYQIRLIIKEVIVVNLLKFFMIYVL